VRGRKRYCGEVTLRLGGEEIAREGEDPRRRWTLQVGLGSEFTASFGWERRLWRIDTRGLGLNVAFAGASVALKLAPDASGAHRTRE